MTYLNVARAYSHNETDLINGYTTDRTKEVYYRTLRPPLKSWQPTRPAQLPLLDGFPLVHS